METGQTEAEVLFDPVGQYRGVGDRGEGFDSPLGEGPKPARPLTARPGASFEKSLGVPGSAPEGFGESAGEGVADRHGKSAGCPNRSREARPDRRGSGAEVARRLAETNSLPRGNPGETGRGPMATAHRLGTPAPTRP